MFEILQEMVKIIEETTELKGYKNYIPYEEQSKENFLIAQLNEEDEDAVTLCGNRDFNLPLVLRMFSDEEEKSQPKYYEAYDKLVEKFNTLTFSTGKYQVYTIKIGAIKFAGLDVKTKALAFESIITLSIFSTGV